MASERGRADQQVDERLAGLGDDRHVSAADVLKLRREIYPDGVVSRGELFSVFELAARAPDGDPEWPVFSAEIAADYFLTEDEPRGYITPGEFTDIKALISRATRPSNAHVELLVKLMESAVSTPAAMTDFVADEIRRLIADGRDASARPRVDAERAGLMRRFLYAAGGAGATGISREEAELLFDVHDLVAGADNDPAWSDLFIKAIAAHLMQHVGYRPLPREDALRLEAWASDQSVKPARFFERMFAGGLAAMQEAYRPAPSWRTKNEENEIAAAIAERVTAREADWLADRIAKNGRVDDAERALIAYMRALNADLPPKLKALIDNAA